MINFVQMNRKRVVIFLSLLIFFTSAVCFAQERGYTGKIVDKTTKEPVPYATVRIKKKTVGVISNAEGDFSMPSWLASAGDTIVISCIGYTTASVPFKSLDRAILNIINLTPAITELKEVVVRSRTWRRRHELSAEKIVETAINSIPKNYPQGPYSYLGYYRDYQVRDSSYLNLNEAVVEVFDRGFGMNDQLDTDIQLYEYKRNYDFERDSATEIPYDNKPNTYDKTKNKYIPNAVLFSFGGNELSVLRVHDAVRNYDRTSYSFVNVFKKDFISNHYFKREEDVLLDTTSLYSISFETRYTVSGSMHFAKGRVLIEKGNFGIHKLEYVCYNKTMKETQVMFDVTVEYARHSGSLYLNYISFNNFFKTQNDVDFKVIGLAYDQFKNAFVVSLNAIPSTVDLTDLENFSIEQGHKSLGIKYVEKIEDRKIAIYLDDASRDMMRKQDDKVSSDLKYRINIRDENNRELDKPTVAVINQFRELFVEQVNTHESIQPNATVIRKDLPLVSNPTLSKADGKYWMNPPLKKR